MGKEKTKLLEYFDKTLQQLVEYEGKFVGHLKAMDDERVKIVDSQKKLQAQIAEMQELRQFIVNRVK